MLVLEWAQSRVITQKPSFPIKNASLGELTKYAFWTQYLKRGGLEILLVLYTGWY